MTETALTIPSFNPQLVADVNFDPALARSMVEECVQNASNITAVLTLQDLNDAGAVIKDIRKIKNELESHRTQLKNPFLDHGRKIDDYFKKLNEGLKAQEDRLSRGMTIFNQKQKELAEAKASEERRRLEEQAEKERVAAQLTGAAVPEIVIPEVVAVKVEKLSSMNSAGIGTRRYKRWEITDLSKVPVEYLQINEVKMNDKRKEYDFDAQSPIPGIKFFVEEKV